MSFDTCITTLKTEPNLTKKDVLYWVNRVNYAIIKLIDDNVYLVTKNDLGLRINFNTNRCHLLQNGVAFEMFDF